VCMGTPVHNEQTVRERVWTLLAGAVDNEGYQIHSPTRLVGPSIYCSTRHRMPSNSINEGQNALACHVLLATSWDAIK